MGLRLPAEIVATDGDETEDSRVQRDSTLTERSST
jgi:hypothetical protein